VTNFAGNAVATVLVATWTKELDREKLSAALSGRDPFDEDTMLDPHDLEEPEAPAPGTDAGPAQPNVVSTEEDLALASRR
jgi:aerobic C4-dicarboxylate transport protein